MLHIITSNRVPVNSLKEYSENFILCHKSKTEINVPYRDIVFQHQFSIYIQSGMNSQIESENYTSSVEEKFLEYQVPTISEALEDIGRNISDDLLSKTFRRPNERGTGGKNNKKQNDTDIEEPIIFCACDPSWNHLACAFLNKYFRRNLLAKYGVNVECLNLFSYLKVVNDDAIKSMIKNILNTDFIYPDEPVSFSYALDRVMLGLV